MQLLSPTRHISSLFIQVEFQVCKFRGKSYHGSVKVRSLEVHLQNISLI